MASTTSRVAFWGKKAASLPPKPRRQRIFPLLAWACTLLSLISCGGASRAPQPEPERFLRLWIEEPESGSRVRQRRAETVVRGWIRASEGPSRPEPRAIVVLLDVSIASLHPSGRDIDLDGEIGLDVRSIVPGTADRLDLLCSDPEDTLLSEELAALTRLLDHSDPELVEIGLIPVDMLPAARRRRPARPIAVSLTRERERLRAGIELLREDKGPGIKLGPALEHALGWLRDSSAPADRRAIVLIGANPGPTADWLPPVRAGLDGRFGEPAMRALSTASSERTSLLVAEVGPYSINPSAGAARIARLGGGETLPLTAPADLVGAAFGTERPPIDGMLIANVDLGQHSGEITITGDGAFSARVPLAPGRNRLLATVVSTRRVEGESQVSLEFEPVEATHWELAQELEELERFNQELLLLIERARMRATGRGRVEVEVELGDGTAR